MTKNYIFGIACMVTFFCKAQLVLTQQANEPANGDLYEVIAHALSSPPVSTGTNQLWDFSTAVAGTWIYSKAYSAQTGTNMTLMSSHTNYGTAAASAYYNSTTNPSQFDLVLESVPGPIGMDGHFYSDYKTLYKWPFAYGNTFNDTYSYHFTNVAGNYNENGTTTVTASGSGTLLLPGGLLYSNVLQIMTATTSTFNANSSPPQLRGSTMYEYFHSSQKFPLCSLVVYLNSSNNLFINKTVVVGMNEQKNDVVDLVYPNPAKDYLQVELKNTHNEICTLEIYNLQGQKLKTVPLADQSFIKTRISISDLPPGIYMLVTNVGASRDIRKLVIE